MVLVPISGDCNRVDREVRTCSKRSNRAQNIRFRPAIALSNRTLAATLNFILTLSLPHPIHRFAIRTGVEPGRVVILLGGAHRGKHAVILKVLDSGLILVTGPHKVNGLPLRRVHQKFIIVTSTKLDLSSVNVPAEINDSYFKRPVEKKVRGAKAQEGEASIFAKRRVEYKLTEKRKADQVTVDKQVLEVIKKHPEKTYLVPYLASHFFLKNKQYPHKMKF